MKLWESDETEHLKLLNSIRAHYKGIWAGSFRSDSKKFVSGCMNQMVKVWNIEENKMSLDFILMGHSNSITDVFLSEDGKTLITATDRESDNKDPLMRIWSIESDLKPDLKKLGIDTDILDSKVLEY